MVRSQFLVIGNLILRFVTKKKVSQYLLIFLSILAEHVPKLITS